MIEPVTIASDTTIPDIKRHFRVSAGPGAGKTHWLINHIRGIIMTPAALAPAQRIACISYTNAAANEIVQRLEEIAWRIDASTIHSFLFRNLVRPYLWMLHDAAGACLVDFAKVDGHEEHRPMRRIVEAWLRSVSKRGSHLVNELLNKNWQETLDYLSSIRWQFDSACSKWEITLPRKKPPEFLPVKKLDEYKALYWKEGVIDHDDVILFAYRLLNENSNLRHFVAAAFPYIFIDEFQDTNPVQMKFIEWFAEAGSVVGVIGDPEQAIFGFQGATREGFLDFDLPDHADYSIEDNRRSTNQIVALLNHVRRDKVQQKAIRSEDGPAVELLIGAPSKTVEHVEHLIGTHVVVLARTNDEVAMIRAAGTHGQPDPWKAFRQVDSGSGRVELWDSLLSACELARAGRFGEGIATLGRSICSRHGNARKPFRYGGRLTVAERDGVALVLMERMLCDFNKALGRTVSEVYGDLANAAEKSLHGLALQGYRSGNPKEFADATQVGALVAAVTMEEETRRFRTIHKAKSAEFEAVLVCFKDEECLDHIVTPNRNNGDEQRITYVALSRARTNLIMASPSLSPEREAALRALQVHVTRLGEQDSCGR